ncbi:hypothetical protein CC80DRAFT_492192 [Byssothecium circinans]|uniref:Transcription factor Rba50 n=1 Tax=Byssothecium circinans TaxID=147558 RepID=A0A6A5TVM4_9PLEO|nr:hypothetical protein CC80DRAFT_492192 [Byssothecium circinans]
MENFVRGERVLFDLDSGGIAENHEPPPNGSSTVQPALPAALVNDILERPTSTTTSAPPVAPTSKANSSGFPEHKKRTPRVSAFKQRRAAQEREAAATAPAQVNKDQDETAARNLGGAAVSTEQEKEKRQIDEENRQKLAAMSQGEIEEEKRELLNSLPKSLIERLLGRADVAQGSNERDWEKEETPEPEAGKTTTTAEDIDLETTQESKPSGTKKVSFAEQDTKGPAPPPAQQKPSSAFTSEPLTAEAQAAAPLNPPTGSMHFPRPPQPPDLDPNDPSFLTTLHEKYFPDLAYDPSQLSWMAPIDPYDEASPYHPSQTSFNASDLRFDFKGALLAPSTARELTVSKGLHHHADAPEAAGYTIPELAVMARSAVPAQRCVAFKTLGRILYRLGNGEFGFEKVRRKGEGMVQQVIKDPNIEEEVDEEDIEVDMEDVGSAMAAGLWACVEEGRVVETLTAEAGKESGHLTARTYAQEALWYWRRGGGRKRQAV